METSTTKTEAKEADCEKSRLEFGKKRLQAISCAFNFHHHFIEILKEAIQEESVGKDKEASEEKDNKSKKYQEPKDKDRDNDESKNKDSTREDTNTKSDIKVPETDKAEISMQGIANRVCIHNLDTLGFLMTQKHEMAREHNSRTLDIVPDNFNALWSKVYIMISENDSIEDDMLTEAEKILHQLETVITKDKNLMLIAKAEVASMHTFLKANLDRLLSSVALYEEVLDELQKLSEQSLAGIEDLIIIWKQDLVQNYARLTYGHKHERAMTVASDIVQELDHHPAIIDKDKARLWVNLAVINQHCVPRYERNLGYPNMELSKFLTAEHCYRKAMKLDPTNPRIFMQAGREQRKRARTVPCLEEAVEWLETALKGDGMEGVKEHLLHHIGLANQNLWHITDYPIYKDIENDYTFRRNVNDGDGSTLGMRVIKSPNHLVDFNQIPAPYKKLPRSTQWRFFNPIVYNTKNRYYLRAKQCFEEAVEIGSDKCLYLIDLARLHSSATDLVKAGECLREAMKGSDSCGPNSGGVSLYENIGFHEETLMMQKGFDHNHAEKIKSFYRESIRQSMHNKWKPVVAFHHLLRILYKQLEDESRFNSERDRMIVQDEYFLLYMAIQESIDPRDIIESLTSSDFKIGLMSRLIQAFHERNKEFDAEAGFVYFSILAVFRNWDKITMAAGNKKVAKKRILLKLAERVVLQRFEQPRYLRAEYRNLYDLISEEPCQRGLDSSSMDYELTKLEKKKMEIVKTMIFPVMTVSCARSIEQC